MITAALKNCPALPIASSDSPTPEGKDGDEVTLQFGAILAESESEPAQPAVPPSTDPAAELGIEEISKAELPEEIATPQSESQPDAVLLSSCLTAWQILPLRPEPLPLTTEPITGGGPAETISPASEEASAPLVDSPAAESLANTKPAPQKFAQEQLPQAEPPSTAIASPTERSAEAANSAPAATITVRLPQDSNGEKRLQIATYHPLAAEAEESGLKRDGIPVAKEHRVMSETVFHQPAKIAPAAFAEGEMPTQNVPEAGLTTSNPAPSAEQDGNDRMGDGTSDQHQNPSADRFHVSTGRGFTIDDEPASEEALAAASNPAEVIQNIERAVERMRSQSNQHLEIRLPMRDGEEVVVKLRLEHGEVKATFQSDSDDLRQALETGWSQAAHVTSERSTRAASTVVESSSLPSGTGSFQQSPGQHERGGTAREFESALQFPSPGAENRKAPSPAHAPLPVRNNSIHNLALYA